MTIDQAISFLMDEAGEIARVRGYFDHPELQLKLALLYNVNKEVLELGEVWARREDAKPSEKCPGYSRAEEEWADIVIKTLRIGAALGYRATAITEKLRVMAKAKIGGKVF